MKRRYLFNPRKPKGAAHIMRGDDTACRMLSTGGMPPSGVVVYHEDDSPNGRRICHMCQNVIGHHTTPAVVKADPDLAGDLTPSERRALRLLAEPGASVSVGLTVYSCLRHRGLAAIVKTERSGKRYVITEAGRAELARKRP